MNRDKIKQFLSDPVVRESLKEGNIERVALMASSLGNLSRDPDLREFSNKLAEKAAQKG